MIDRKMREEFVNCLYRMINGSQKGGDWFTYIIEHYPDKRLEEIRRDIVRLRIAAGDPKIFPQTESQREKLRNWATELSENITKS